MIMAKYTCLLLNAVQNDPIEKLQLHLTLVSMEYTIEQYISTPIGAD